MDIDDLNSTMNQIDPMDIYRTFYQTKQIMYSSHMHTEYSPTYTIFCAMKQTLIIENRNHTMCFWSINSIHLEINNKHIWTILKCLEVKQYTFK